jgi:hypothetical protein
VTTTAGTPRTRTGDLFGLLDPGTYRRSLHLLTDLPLGLVTSTAATTLLAVSAGLAVTLLGVPLLVGGLAAARGLGRVERGRARVLLGVPVPPPPVRHGLRDRLADPAAWRGLGYAVLLGPVGLLTGGLTFLGWATALGAIAFPAYAWALRDPAVHLGDLTLAGAPAAAGTVLCGLALLAALPALVRLLARGDTALVRALLR